MSKDLETRKDALRSDRSRVRHIHFPSAARSFLICAPRFMLNRIEELGQLSLAGIISDRKQRHRLVRIVRLRVADKFQIAVRELKECPRKIASAWSFIFPLYAHIVPFVYKKHELFKLSDWSTSFIIHC